MRFEEKKRVEYLTIFDPNKKYTQAVNNVQALFYALSGQGKTLAVEKFVEKFKKDGSYIPIVITEKFIHRLEFGFAGFKPRHKYHLDYLKEQGITPDRKEIKIHAPFSFNDNRYWQKKLFPVNLITFPVKEIPPEIWAIIFETSTKAQSINAVVSAQKDLLPHEGVTDLIRIASEKIRKNQVSGSEKTISDIKTFLEPFQTTYFLTSENCEYNFNPDDILLNPIPYHIFHYGFFPRGYIKQEYVAVNLVLYNLIKRYEELRKDRRMTRKLNPLLLVIQEVLAFLPQNFDEIYIEKSAQIFEKNLLQIRGLGISTVGDSQKVFQTNERYRDSMTVEYYGKLPTPDVERLGKIRRYNVDQRTRLESMPKNHYFMKGSYKESVFLFPSHAHCEEGEDFYVRYAEEFPDKLKDNKTVHDYMKQQFKDERDRQKVFLKEKLRKKREKRVEKDLKKIEKLEKSEVEKEKMRSEIKVKDTELQNQLYINMFRDSKLNGKKLSWVRLGKKYDMNDKTAKSHAEKGKELVKEAPV